MTREEAIKHLTNDWFKMRNGQVCVEYDHSDRFLEAVGMAIAALREQPRWISMEERLPGVDLLGKYIIICIKNRWNERRVDTVHWWGPEQMHGAAWFWSDVTHWMPMPEPPKY